MDYVDGFAVHWYWNFIVPPAVIDQTHKNFPDKLIFNTEACLGDKPWDHHGPILGKWSRAEEYVENILEDLNNHVSGWIDWNLVLDERGGPNYVDNTVEAAVIANVTSNLKSL
jgi:glucosylceramidase